MAQDATYEMAPADIQMVGSLFHLDSTDPDGWTKREPHYPNRVVALDRIYEHDCSPDYNRTFKGYESQLSFFRVADWVGKRLLDIGSGMYDRFGRYAREIGVHAVSINPALRLPEHRVALNDARESDYYNLLSKAQIERKWWHLIPKRPPYPKISSVAAVGQALPFRDESFDAVVSVFGVPQYLHHVDPTLKDPQEIVAAYTLEVRARDKLAIGMALSEVMRVLNRGGVAYLRDEHRSPGQTEGISSLSPSDGTEVLEVLDGLRSQGAIIDVHTLRTGLTIGKGVVARELPNTIGKTQRLIVMQRPS
jgi:SAM-dependent methyltransferase